MAQEPLHAGVLRLLEAARDEEWTLDRSLGAERERPPLREGMSPAPAARRAAPELLRQLRAGVPVDGCAEPVVADVGGWERVHADAHRGRTELLAEPAGPAED